MKPFPLLIPALALISLPSVSFSEDTPAVDIRFEGTVAEDASVPILESNVPNAVRAEGMTVSLFRKSSPNETPREKIEVADTPDFAGKSFLRISRSSGSKHAGILIKPENSERSLAAVSKIAPDGRIVFDGAIDWFFRFNNVDSSVSLKFIDCSGDDRNSGAEGIRLVLQQRGGVPIAVLQTRKPAFDTIGDGHPNTATLQTRNERTDPFEMDQIIHIAVTLKTDQAGLTIIKVFKAAGNEPIDTTSDNQLVASAQGYLLKGPTSGFSDGAFEFGYLDASSPEGSDAVLDIAAFRVFSPVPASLPAL